MAPTESSKSEESRWRWGLVDTLVRLAFPVLVMVTGVLCNELLGTRDQLASLDRRLSLVEASQGDNKANRTALSEIKILLAGYQADLRALRSSLEKVERQLERRGPK